MGTRKVKVRGLAYWAKVFESNRDLTGFEDALKEVGGQTTIDLDLFPAEVEKVKKSGCMKTGTKSADNPDMTRFKFSRKWESPYEGLGGEPTVTKADGTVWNLDDDGFIGNGSVVDVTLMVYDTKRKGIIGTRLEAIRVVENVAYDPDAGMPDIKARPYAGKKDETNEEAEAPLVEAAKRVVARASERAASKKVVEDLDDEIPF